MVRPAKTIKDEDHYLTIPYGRTKNGPSVAHWVAECHARCEADNVRSFLKDLLTVHRADLPTPRMPERTALA